MDHADPKQEFRDLLHKSGWTQAEAARQLKMTPSGLSQIVRPNSPVRPSPVTLQLFRLLLLREAPHANGPGPARTDSESTATWEHDLIRELRGIPAKSRQPILRALLAMIAAAKNKRNGRRRG